MPESFLIIKALLILMVVFGLVGCCATHPGQSSVSKTSQVMQPAYPQDANQATEWLLKELTREQIEEIKSKPEAEMVHCQFTIGLWVRNNWLVRTTTLRTYFNQQGIHDREDMVYSFWYRLALHPWRTHQY